MMGWGAGKYRRLKDSAKAEGYQSSAYNFGSYSVSLESRINVGLHLLIFGAFIQGLRPYQRGLCLLFLPNVPGAMFIPVATSIPDSKVNHYMRPLYNSKQNIGETSYEGLTE